MALTTPTAQLINDINLQIDTNGVQAITGHIMNLTLNAMVGNDWFVDANGDRYILPSGLYGVAIVGASPQTFFDQFGGPPPELANPKFGVQGDTMVVGTQMAIGDTLYTNSLAAAQGLADGWYFMNITDPAGPGSHEIAMAHSTADGADTNILAVVEFPMSSAKPFVAIGSQRMQGSVDAKGVFVTMGDMLSSNGHQGGPDLLGMSFSANNGTTGNATNLFFSEFGLSVNGYLHLHADPNPSNYMLEGGEIRFTSGGVFQGYDGATWVDFAGGGGGGLPSGSNYSAAF